MPRPEADQVVVRVHSCGICGSDIHQLRDGWGLPKGVVAGHEWSGTIAAVGDGVTNWSVGELVVGGSSPKCGTCRRCREGKPSQCENRYNMSNGTATAPSPSTSWRAPPASCGCPRASPPPCRAGRTAVGRPARHHPLGRRPRRLGHGLRCGAIGTLSIAALRALGITDITAVEPNESRRQLAALLGATVVDPDELEVFPSWEPERQAARAAHVVLECSGHRAPSRRRSARSGAAASSSWSAPASTTRPSTSTA